MIIGVQFKLIEEIIAKYSIYNNNVHNFNKTSFQIGVISSIKVVTGLERRVRPDLIQLGDCKWVIVIQSICAAGYAIPPFIIYKERVHISAQYEETNIPCYQKLLVSKNRQITNKLRLMQLKHFNVYIKTRQVGSYQLLILDSYKSY